MCMGCMSHADFLVTSGALSVSGLRIGLRALLPVTPAFARKVTEDEAAAFVASLAPSPGRAPAPDTRLPAGC